MDQVEREEKSIIEETEPVKDALANREAPFTHGKQIWPIIIGGRYSFRIEIPSDVVIR